MLDATKAFDRVHFGKLFTLLRERQVPAIYLRIMLDMYTRQRVYTTWNGAKSRQFNIANGVKQGAILSPILFCVYIDDLLNRLNGSGLGCHVGHLSFAGIGYADDVCILSPSINALQRFLKICENFANDYDILFNAKKSICIKIGPNGTQPTKTVRIFDSAIPWTTRVKHLGNYITSDLSDDADIVMKKAKFISQVNTVNVKFASVPSLIRGRLLQNYCCSWYGCQTWDAVGKSVQQLNTEWNKAVRRTLRIPYTTHRKLLPLLTKNKPFSEQHLTRLSKFVDSFKVSQNTHVALLGNRACFTTTGALGRNMVRCAAWRKQNDYSFEQEDYAIAECIRDLISTRENSHCLYGFSDTEIDTMISSLCCD